MLNQFSRTELLLGHDNMEKLKKCQSGSFWNRRCRRIYS